MLTKNYTVSFSPSQDQMNNIYSWTTFPLNNFSSIDQAYRQKTICIALFDNLVIGFFAYKLSSRCINIVIAETKQGYRNTGVAKLILAKLADHLSLEGYAAFHLYCSPKESQYIWKHLGFNYYPASRYGKRSEKIKMYKVFVDCCSVLDISNKGHGENIIEIWNEEAGGDDKSATWFARICVDENKKLVKPFIFFGDNNWSIKIDNKFGRYKDYDRKSDVTECFYIDELK